MFLSCMFTLKIKLDHLVPRGIMKRCECCSLNVKDVRFIIFLLMEKDNTIIFDCHRYNINM